MKIFQKKKKNIKHTHILIPVLADWCGPKAPTLEAPKKTKEASNVCFLCIKLKKRGSALLQSYFIFSFLTLLTTGYW